MGQQYAFKHANMLRHVCMLLFLLPFALGCDENKEPSVYAPTLTTNSVTGVSRFGATFQGTVMKHPDSTGDLTIGFLYSTSASLSNAQEVNATPEDGSNYTAKVEGLTPGVKYYYCIFARSGKSIVKGKTSSFDTEDAIQPSLSAAKATDVTESGFTLTATITDNGGYEPTVRGFVYAIYVENAGDPVLDDYNTQNKPVTGDQFEVMLSDLAANTTYIVRPYATNNVGTGYGESDRFTTSQQKIPMVIANGSGSLADKPVETTAYEAVCMGTVTEDHGFTVTEYGFCYSTESRQPTLESSQNIQAQNGTKGFSATLAGLTASTKYYMRAYAKSEKGIGYSATVEFTTDKEQVVSLTQATVTDRTSSSISITAQMAYESFSTIKEKGICYAETENPTINGSKVTDSSTEKNISVTITGLEEGKTYHARAYAITRDGTFYSGDIAVTTETTHAPSLDKPTVYDKTDTGAKVRATISTNGELAVTEKGICYSSTNNEPTVDDTKVISTEAGNNILVSLSGLQGGVTYYVRAYAINGKGTGYSSIEQFTTTKHTEPALNGLNISAINDDNAQASAAISNVGGEGEKITERGFVVSVGGTPAVDDNSSLKFVSKDAADSFTATLTGLSYNTLYNIRAYAKNSIGTGYSSMLSFETGSSTTATLGDLKCVKAEAHSLSFEFEVNSTGGAVLTDYGFKWRPSSGGDETTVKGTLNGTTMTGTISGLTENSSYYVRGYVINKNGMTETGYYNSFNTAKLPPGAEDNPTPGDDNNTRRPALNYLSYSEVYATTAWLSCSINDEGNLPVTEKGFIYKVDDGTKLSVDNGTKVVITTTGTSMKTKLTGLTGKTRYRVRAYAINAKGIGYSSEQIFTTEDADKPGPGEGDNPTPEPKN